MTSQYRDSTTLVSDSSIADGYSNIRGDGLISSTAPPSSLLKLTVAPGSTKYFNVSPQFEQRQDSFRIPPPSKTPVNLTGNPSQDLSAITGNRNSDMPSSNNTEYFSLGRSYKLN